jgi:MoaD family protein
MSIKVAIPAPLRDLSSGRDRVELSGDTVGDLFVEMGRRYQEMVERLMEDGKVLPYVNVYVNRQDIRSLQNLDTVVEDGDEVRIAPAVAGG